jgi:GNAT superfamily N-acetyltransferase
MAEGDTMARPIEARSYAVEEIQQNGRRIGIRAIRPDDKARLLEHFAGLSARSRYFRFFGHKRALTNEDLVRFTELDFDRHVGIAATVYQDGRERFIGVARYVRKKVPSRAEIALAVLDEYQGEGVGPLLIRHLARIAQGSGLTQFEADVRGDNSRMLAALRKGGCIINHANGAGVIHFTLNCPGHAASVSGSEL